MKEWLKKNLPPATKLSIKRAIGRIVRPMLYVLPHRNDNSLVEFLKCNVLLQDSELDLERKRSALAVPDFSSKDFAELRNELIACYPSLSADRQVCVSIIIPVFNNCNFTFQCLRSLFRQANLLNTEVVIVNDGSTDETRELLSYLVGWVRVINNKKNSGFIDASNQGAAAAQGKYLVFLNNDTIVCKDWLPELVQTIGRDKSVGAVGSMFLYPDGSIQEAGAIIWDTGEAHHYGWGKSPVDRRFNFAREVDYCSGASLLIRRDLFNRLGGFDRLYAPAYYEDADLCFGVRALGYKVIYQPASRVIHFEGATAGIDIREGVKHFQVVNQVKFFTKWQRVIETEQYGRDRSNERLASDRRTGPEVIVFDDRVPTPSRDAGSARMMFMLQALTHFSKPVFVYNCTPDDMESERELWRRGIETRTLIDYPRLLRERKFSVAIASRPHVAHTVIRRLRRHRPRLKLIFDMVDAHFVRFEREHAVTGDNSLQSEARRFKKLEIDLVRQSDLVFCNSSEDKRRVSSEAENVLVEVIPTIHPLRSRGKPFAERRDLFFVGHFKHRPNADGMRFFLTEILPLIKHSLPNVKVYIAGTDPPADIQAFADDSIHVLGFVPNVEPFFHNTRLFVAPVRFGAGVKGKIGDSLSYGLPVVTTTLGAEGMGLTNRKEAMIADAAEDFARALVEAYEDAELWRLLSDNGYAHIGKNFGPEVVEEVVRRAIVPNDSDKGVAHVEPASAEEKNPQSLCQ
ncbi:MAG: glycosyltransferase [Pyrinomonadaceae bacterium]